MEILLWLLPAASATLVATLWVSWWGREGRGEVDREEAARRLGAALTRERRVRPGYAVARREADRASGVALRPSRMRPVVVPGSGGGEAVGPAAATSPADDVSGSGQAARSRRAS